MARKLRLQFEGAIYHVMNRGDRREPIFKDDTDRQTFLTTLCQACAKTDWQVHAYCLMPNHFHLVVETPQANLIPGMKWLLGTYTGRFNRRHKLFGHLFGGRLQKSLIVDGRSDGYLRTVCDYVHLNPARARLLKPTQPLRSYHWSSWPGYLGSPHRRPSWLRVDRLLGEHHFRQDTRAGRRQLEAGLEARRAAEDGQDYKPIRRGWFLGDKESKEQLLEQVFCQTGAWHYGEEIRESGEARAERILLEELQKLRWDEQTLAARPKGDPMKVKLAGRLRTQTTVPLVWIARRLGMGTRGYLTHLLYRWDRGKDGKKL